MNDSSLGSMCVCLHLCIDTCDHACVYVCMRACMCDSNNLGWINRWMAQICMNAYTYARAYTCMYY
jgi:hypothetical protein